MGSGDPIRIDSGDPVRILQRSRWKEDPNSWQQSFRISQRFYKDPLRIFNKMAERSSKMSWRSLKDLWRNVQNINNYYWKKLLPVMAIIGLWKSGFVEKNIKLAYKNAVIQIIYYCYWSRNPDHSQLPHQWIPNCYFFRFSKDSHTSRKAERKAGTWHCG